MEFSKTCSMQFLANVVRILPKKLLFLCPVVLLSLSVPFSVASSAKAEDTTYVACYFQDAGGTTWQWGLVGNNNSWYNLRGRWGREGVTKFETSTPRDEMIESCRQSQRYYNHGGKNLINVYAADKSAGSNYAIYVNGQELKP